MDSIDVLESDYCIKGIIKKAEKQNAKPIKDLKRPLEHPWEWEREQKDSHWPDHRWPLLLSGYV